MASGLTLMGIVDGDTLTINNATLEDELECTGTISGSYHGNHNIIFRSHEHPYYSDKFVWITRIGCEQTLVGEMDPGNMIIYIHSHTPDEWNCSIGFGSRFGYVRDGIILKSVDEPTKGVYDG
jgi:hypothetical protein